MRDGKEHRIEGHQRGIVMAGEHEVRLSRKRGVDVREPHTGIGVGRYRLELEIRVCEEQADELRPGVPRCANDSYLIRHVFRPSAMYTLRCSSARRTRGRASLPGPLPSPGPLPLPGPLSDPRPFVASICIAHQNICNIAKV